ncbi:17008_t:CDS:2, partial [Gigaspora rosea]
MAKENHIKDATNGDYNVKNDDYDPTTDAYSTIMSSLVPVCGQLLYLKPATEHHRWIVDKIDDLMFCWPITTPIIWVCIARCKIQLWWKDLFAWIYTGLSLFYSSYYTNIVLQNLFTNCFIWTGTFLFLSRFGTHYLGADESKYCTLACIMKDEIMSKPLSLTNIYHCNIFTKIDNTNNNIREFFKNKIISTLVNDKINIQAEEEPQNMNLKNNLEAKIKRLEERISRIETQN